MQPTETESPREALKLIEAGAPFDVAILDMHMPDMDGMMLAEEIRKHRDSDALPLVLFTSLGRREIGEERVEFSIHLTKPIKPSQLYNGLIEIFAGEIVSLKKSDRTDIETDSDLAKRLPLRILLTEDNVINQKLALRLLLNMGYRADVAANGLEAIQSLERQDYDVILMDVQMPEMDGLEATRQIVKRWNGEERPRIIAMTANAMAGDREKCIEAGMDDYITKPIRVAELVGALSKTVPISK
jgi:CheY-like chemotaxis protein